MIRRDMRLADGSAGWMLISQVEHARVSAELAAQCTVDLGAASRDEVLAAIRHHDDGWCAWEAAPRLDADGRPVAFVEIEPDEVVAIWTGSVDAAERVGPLAAWMVAGHFLRLARRNADGAAAARFERWRLQMTARRDVWLADWRRVDPDRRTPELAEVALQWLWTFDEVSLWLCCSCLAGESIPCSPEPYVAGRGTPVEMELRPVGQDEPVLARATATPWRFDAAAFDVTIAGRAVPAGRYRSSAELMAAAIPRTLAWRLVGAGA
jgi:hypothetical protein